MRRSRHGVQAALGAVALACLLALTGCTEDDPRAVPEPSPTTPGPAATSAPGPSDAPDPAGDPEAVPTPEDFVVAGVDCGLLDQRRSAAVEPDDGFEAADRCIANALRTGQDATFRLVSESLEGDAVFARFAVEGPGRLAITEDHRAVVTSPIDERVKTCTEARSLSAQGNCTAREVERGAGG